MSPTTTPTAPSGSATAPSTASRPSTPGWSAAPTSPWSKASPTSSAATRPSGPPSTPGPDAAASRLPATPADVHWRIGGTGPSADCRMCPWSIPGGTPVAASLPEGTGSVKLIVLGATVMVARPASRRAPPGAQVQEHAMRRPAAVVLLSLVLLVAVALPAGAVGAFGPPVTVVPSPCSFIFATADAALGADGLTRGFATYTGSGCDDEIWYFQGSGSSWTPQLSPYRGVVLGV